MSVSGYRIRAVYEVSGTIQGVGFRPTVFRLATETGLGGSVQNRSGSVRIVLEGVQSDIDSFVERLPSELPPNALIDEMSLCSKERLPDDAPAPSFSIAGSNEDDDSVVSIPPDIVMCDNCRAEIMDRAGHRYGYPFTTCTACGPRYTVVNGMPYDRERTTMSVFPLCPVCRSEYEDATDRRFHAETIACSACGPKLWFESLHGGEQPGNPLRNARRALQDGSIVAVRGLGGYLLACDATDPLVVRRLRERKKRPHKPFAVMAADLGAAMRICRLPSDAAELLTSPRGPIVILNILDPDEVDPALPLDLLTPDAPTLGVMLPTTPLHYLLAHPLSGDRVPRFDLLVMTSGNRTGEPICLTDDEARDRLQGIADYILTHDREINLRNDDSLCTMQFDAVQVWRRARGYAPEAIPVEQDLARCVLATGAELKNTIAIGYDRRIVLSPHVGDLETPEALDGLETVATCFPRFLNKTPEAVAVDLHPDMQSARLGQRLARDYGVPLARIQHHHAHAAACLGEHGRNAGLALTFDGTGLGTDNTIWGAELFDVTPESITRLATFRPVRLPGGDAAVLAPARQLVARWLDAELEISDTWLRALDIKAGDVAVWETQCEKGINAPLTHAAGRLFDAFAALLGLAPAAVTYEAQAPVKLESAARRGDGSVLLEIPYDMEDADGLLQIDWRPAFRYVGGKRIAGSEIPAFAMAFHKAVASAAVEMVEHALYKSKARVIALSGGVFMNRILTRLVHDDLRDLGLDVLIHRKVPPNDGGIAFGQALIAGGVVGRQETAFEEV